MCEQTFSKQQTNPQIRVYVANIGKYNEGKLVGAWLDLPTTHNQIQSFLKNQVGLNNQYEEYLIHDYESDFNHDENENIYDLNLLAIKLEQMSENEKALAAAYCSANGLKDTLTILNVCHQVNDISYVEIDANTWGTKEEKLGYTIIDEIDTDLKTTLEQCKIGESLTAYDYFDFEKYGHDISISEGYFATDSIFIFYTTDINHKLYTIQEIKEQLTTKD
jgi:antirestriction protein